MEKKYKADPEIMLRVIAGEAVLIPIGTKTQEFNGMATISVSAKYLWEAMEEDFKSRNELTDLLLEKYDCTRTEAASDVDAFIEALTKKRMLIEEDLK